MRGPEGEPDPVPASQDDPAVASLSEAAGGALGRHAGRHPWWTPVRWLLLLTALTCALGMVQKTGCYVDTWEDGQQRYVQMCYSDLPYLYTGRGLAELTWPYADTEGAAPRHQVMEYPVGIVYWAWGTAWVTHWLNGSPDLAERRAADPASLWGLPSVHEEITLYVAVNAIGFALLALLATWLLAGTTRGRPWHAAAFALSPALLFTGLINWDLTAVVFVAGALWAWSKDKPVLTGVMIGLGTATKLYPLFLLGGVLIACLRRRRWTDLAAVFAAAGIAWLLANLPALASSVESWKVFWSFNSDRGPDLGSLWLFLAQAGDLTIDAATVNRWSWLLFGLWCLGVLVLGLRAPQTPRLAQLGFLIVAGFLIVNKVYSPQYVLWLLPLAVLARPRWRDQLIWQGCELFYFAAVWWYLGGFLQAGAGDDQPFYWAAILVRVAAELWLCGLIVRDILRPDGTVPGDEPDDAPLARGEEPQEMSTRSNAVAV